MSEMQETAERQTGLRLLYLVPALIVLVLGVFFYVGLQRDSQLIPSVLIDQPVPPFDLKPIKGYDRGFSNTDLLGQVTLVNIFGSWCVACLQEHPFLMELQREGAIPIYGIDWREKDPDAGPQWLARRGDPYTLIGDDPDSKAAIAFGVTGAPETFVVDHQGIIRYKHIGPLDRTIWEEKLLPLIERLRAEAG